MIKGQLISWNDEKGFGFIKSESLQSDTFIHISSLKSMSRKPKVGDFIYFEIEKQRDGKTRATNCRIAGVPMVKHKPKTRPSKKSSRSVNKLVSFALLLLVIYGFQQFNTKTQSLIPEPVSNSEPQTLVKPAAPSNFRCDGRQYCSQMHSWAEAVFFIQNCPNTKMDGDHDGIPCENDSRFPVLIFK